MESQSINLDRYLEELKIHRTTNKVDLTPSPYPKRFSPIPNSLDFDLKDKTENIPYILTSSKTVSKTQIKSEDGIALREFQQSLKCVITWLEAMGYSFSLNSTEHVTKAVKRLPNFLRHSFLNTKIFIH